ncbi:MAG: class 1 fructose-bisphosphatase [Campylobacterota bacterium]
MVEIFNSIANAATRIEKDVFKNCSDFIDVDASEEAVHEAVFDHCQDIIEREFEKTRSVNKIISQDKKQYCYLNKSGKYTVTYKAIDNIELLDVDFSLGTIFGVYEHEVDAAHLKAAAYVTYGPTFQLVFATKTEGVKFFNYEEGEFRQQESFTLNEIGKINATGGDVRTWSSAHKTLVQSFFEDGYRLRFSDSLALDTHQILFKKGGIYSNPATRAHPEGKLELLFECYPIAFILNLAGGEATDGEREILQKPLEDIHQKSPLYFGSQKEMQRVKETSL